MGHPGVACCGAFVAQRVHTVLFPQHARLFVTTPHTRHNR